MKVLISGVAAGVCVLAFSVAFSMVFGMVFPGVAQEYVSAVFRPWSDPLMSLFFLYPFVLGLALAWAWPKVNAALHGKSEIEKGAKFGFGYWVVAGIPGMLMSYSSFNVSLLMVLGWSVAGLAEAMIAGIVIAKLQK